MKLLKFLASVTVCIAFDSGVESLSDVHPDSHSIRKGRALSDGSMQLNGKAKDGKSDMGEEERNAGEIFASAGRYFGRPAAKENAGLSEELLPKGTGGDDFATNLKNVVGLIEKVNEGYSDKGPSLMKLVVKMQNVEESKEFADTTMVTMLKNPKTMNLVVKAWIESGKTPTEVSGFLLRHVKDEKWFNFVKGDLFNPWLTYVRKYYMSMKEISTFQDRVALATSVKKLIHGNRNMDEVTAASVKLEDTYDGKFVAHMIAFA